MSDLLVSTIVTAAIAGLVSWLWNLMADKRRARRDFRSRLFDSTRNEVRTAAEIAIPYFSTVPRNRSLATEATIMMLEREIRLAITKYLADWRNGRYTEKHDLEKRLDDFIDALTGANFQSRNGKADPAQSQKVAKMSAELRTALDKARDVHLAMGIFGQL